MENKDNQENKIGLIALVALTVSSVVGAGIFNLSSDMAKNAAPGPTIVALILSGLGMGLFVFSLRNLHKKFPHLEAGIYSYAKKGFGPFVGFISAIGYWASIVLGNVALATLMFSGLAYFFPIFGDGQNIWSVIGASLLLWMMHYVTKKGAKTATSFNNLVTVMKIVPLLIFIGVILFNFDPTVFTMDFWGTASGNFSWSEVGPQLNHAMITAVWVFVGVEGAIVFSGRAKSEKIVSMGNILSFAIIVGIYLLATVPSFGILSQAEIAALDKPALGGILEAVVGKWGAILINIGVIFSTFGTWFSCNILAGEIVFQASKDEIFPRFLKKENDNQAPINGLWLSNGLVQFFLMSMLISKSAYNFMALLASSTMLIPYFFVSLTQGKISYKNRVIGQTILGILSTLYMGFAIYSSGLNYILVTSLLFAPSLILYIISRKENNRKIFTRIESMGALLIIVLAIISIFFIITSRIDISAM